MGIDSLMSCRFAMAWLSVMILFPISNLLLKFDRGSIKRKPKVGLLVVFMALISILIGTAGNIALNPLALA
jgi:hypothetical protein